MVYDTDAKGFPKGLGIQNEMMKSNDVLTLPWIQKCVMIIVRTRHKMTTAEQTYVTTCL